MPPIPAAFQHIGLLALVSVLALLIGNTAAGLAGGLAGSLAFAAATLILAQNAGLNGLDVLHGFHLPYAEFYPSTLPYPPGTVNHIFQFFHSHEAGVLFHSFRHAFWLYFLSQYNNPPLVFLHSSRQP